MRTHISVRRVPGRRIPDEHLRAARADAVVDGARPVSDDDWAVATMMFALRNAYLSPGAPPPPGGGEGRPGA
jgi:hypothetical protein